MKLTQFLSLKKIDLSDSPPDITVINDNWDKIDSELNPTIDPTATPTGNTGLVKVILGGIANRIKAITGGVNWWDTPVKSIKQLDTSIGNTTSLTTTNKTNLVAAINENTSQLGDIAIENALLPIDVKNSGVNKIHFSIGMYEFINGHTYKFKAILTNTGSVVIGCEWFGQDSARVLDLSNKELTPGKIQEGKIYEVLFVDDANEYVGCKFYLLQEISRSITFGTTPPSGGSNGDIYFQYE